MLYIYLTSITIINVFARNSNKLYYFCQIVIFLFIIFFAIFLSDSYSKIYFIVLFANKIPYNPTQNLNIFSGVKLYTKFIHSPLLRSCASQGQAHTKF